jgi:hypothetical protein
LKRSTAPLQETHDKFNHDSRWLSSVSLESDLEKEDRQEFPRARKCTTGKCGVVPVSLGGGFRIPKRIGLRSLIKNSSIPGGSLKEYQCPS